MRVRVELGVDDACGPSPQGCDCAGLKLCKTGVCTSFGDNLMICDTCAAGPECS